MDQTLRVERLLSQAIRESGLPFRKKFQVQMLLLIPGVRRNVSEYFVGMLIETAFITNESDISAIGDGELLKLIIENLPQLLEFIMTLIGLFS